MPKIFVKSALSVIIAFGMTNIAAAETPPEVVESYEAYKAALLTQKQEQAEQSALAAWEAAEETLGKAKITGDFAQNYADIAVVNKSNYKKIRKAYKRSVELASFYPEDEALAVRMDRTISLASILRRRELSSSSMRSLINRTIRDAEAANVQATTPLADIYTLRAIQSYHTGFRKWARRNSSQAVAIYAEAQDDLSSPYRDIAEKLACKNCDNPLIDPRDGDLKSAPEREIFDPLNVSNIIAAGRVRPPGT